MATKEFYIFLIRFYSQTSELKVINTAIASTHVEARALAIEDAIQEHGEHLGNWEVATVAYPMRRPKLEQAAREVLGWDAPPTH